MSILLKRIYMIMEDVYFGIWLFLGFIILIYPLLRLIFPSYIFEDPPRRRDTEIPYARLKSQYTIALDILREQGIEEDKIIEILKERVN